MESRLAGGIFGGFAVVGSAAFLASSMKMPLTAIILVLEFTRVGHDFLIPISLAVAGSISVFHLCTQNIFQRAEKFASAGVPGSQKLSMEVPE